MKKLTAILATFTAVAIQGPAASAGESTPGSVTNSPLGFDWCERMSSKPLSYKNSETPLIQGFYLGGRIQYQAAYVDGTDVNGRDFNETYDEYRRVRIETKTDFLHYFSANIKLNMVNDGRKDGDELDWGYDTFDEAVLTFDLKKAFGAGALDALKINYGRFKFNMTEEVHMSSKEIPTVERSATANKLYGANSRPTGVTVDAGLGKWSATVGLFSGEDDSEFIGGWNDGRAYYLTLAHETSDEWRFGLDTVVNDRSGVDDFLGYEWAMAANAIYEKDRFGAITTAVLGRNHGSDIRGGMFHALVVVPYYWLVEDRLQAVFKYQYAGASEGEGIRINSRYGRSLQDPGVDVNSGYGDELHTVYAGLNYHLCGHNAKIMGGVEYQVMDTPVGTRGKFDTLTWLVALRGFF